MGMGKAEAALDEARRAIELEPERAEAWFEAARALLRLGRLEEAAETVRSGLGQDAQSSWGHLLHSAITSQQGDQERALEAAQRAVQLAPSPCKTGRGWLDALHAVDVAAVSEVGKACLGHEAITLTGPPTDALMARAAP